MIDYRLVDRFERVRANDVALHTLQSKSKGVVLDASDLMCNGLLCFIHLLGSPTKQVKGDLRLW